MARKVIANPQGWRCDGCKKWLLQEAEAYSDTTDKGIVKTSECLRMGLKIVDGSTVKVAPCTTGPTWVGTTDDNWCWQYVPRLEQ